MLSYVRYVLSVSNVKAVADMIFSVRHVLDVSDIVCQCQIQIDFDCVVYVVLCHMLLLYGLVGIFFAASNTFRIRQEFSYCIKYASCVRYDLAAYNLLLLG